MFLKRDLVYELRRREQEIERLRKINEELMRNAILDAPADCKIGSWCKSCKHGREERFDDFAFSKYVCTRSKCSHYEEKDCSAK